MHLNKGYLVRNIIVIPKVNHSTMHSFNKIEGFTMLHHVNDHVFPIYMLMNIYHPYECHK
jgi:hypothetical protein